MLKKKVLFIAILLIFLFPAIGYPQEDKVIYHQGVEAAKAGDADTAFMDFYNILNTFPQSKFFKDALFATGEYYFLVADYPDAAKIFIRFIDRYPESKTKIFSLTYLLKIARIREDKNLATDLEKKIVSFQRLCLFFRDFKEYKYVSALGKNYKAVFFIDKIVIYVDDGIFAEISY